MPIDNLTALFRSMGSLHVQWGKSYPYLESLTPEAKSAMMQLKALLDPGNRMNPGVLGLGNRGTRTP